jgi:hypothetical protein
MSSSPRLKRTKGTECLAIKVVRVRQAPRDGAPSKADANFTFVTATDLSVGGSSEKTEAIRLLQISGLEITDWVSRPSANLLVRLLDR